MPPRRPSGPSYAEVESRFVALLEGTMSRDEVDRWASRFVEADADVDDPVVWRALTRLAGIDLPDERGEPLHGKDQIRAWLGELRQGVAGTVGATVIEARRSRRWAVLMNGLALLILAAGIGGLVAGAGAGAFVAVAIGAGLTAFTLTDALSKPPLLRVDEQGITSRRPQLRLRWDEVRSVERATGASAISGSWGGGVMTVKVLVLELADPGRRVGRWPTGTVRLTVSLLDRSPEELFAAVEARLGADTPRLESPPGRAAAP